MAGASIQLPRVSVEFKSEKLRSALKQTEELCRDSKPAWREIGEVLLLSVQKNFDEGGRPDKWEPLSSSTLIDRVGGKKKAFTKKGAPRARYRKEIAGHKILIRTGRLLRSMTYEAMRDGVRVGTNVIYAAIHQFGGKAGRGKAATIPARPFLAVQPEDESTMASILERHLSRPLR